MATGLPRTIERVGGGFRAGGEIGARGTGLGIAHGAGSPLLPGARALRNSAAFSRIKRAELGELDRADPPSLRKRASEPQHVPSKKIFYVRGLGAR